VEFYWQRNFSFRTIAVLTLNLLFLAENEILPIDYCTKLCAYFYFSQSFGEFPGSDQEGESVLNQYSDELRIRLEEKETLK
jgi:hypothetical protein